MKKFILLLLVAFLSVTAHAQKSAADSLGRMIELVALRDRYVTVKKGIEAAKAKRVLIEEFHIGRTEEEKQDEEDENDKLQLKLIQGLTVVELMMKERYDAFKTLYTVPQ